MNSAPALPPLHPIHADLARECGKAWPPFHRLDLGPSKADRRAERNAAWRQSGEVIEFPVTASDMAIGDGSARL